MTAKQLSVTKYILIIFQKKIQRTIQNKCHGLLASGVMLARQHSPSNYIADTRFIGINI